MAIERSGERVYSWVGEVCGGSVVVGSFNDGKEW